jgi:hypothetical protein
MAKSTSATYRVVPKKSRHLRAGDAQFDIEMDLDGLLSESASQHHQVIA